MRRLSRLFKTTTLDYCASVSFVIAKKRSQLQFTSTTNQVSTEHGAARRSNLREICLRCNDISKVVWILEK